MKRAMKKYDVLMICLIVFSALFILWILLSVLPKDEHPEETLPVTEEKTETEKELVVVYALPSVESVFEQWNNGEFEDVDLAGKIREKQTDPSADDWLTLEDLPVYELDSDYKKYFRNKSVLEVVCKVFPVQMAIPLGNEVLCIVHKLKQGDQIVYGYHTFRFYTCEVDSFEMESQWSYLASGYITEALSVEAFSAVKSGDPMADVLDICPSVIHVLGRQALFFVPVKEGVWLMSNIYDTFDNHENEQRVGRIAFYPYNDDADEFREQNPSAGLIEGMCFLQAEYMLLPE